MERTHEDHPRDGGGQRNQDPQSRHEGHDVERTTPVIGDSSPASVGEQGTVEARRILAKAYLTAKVASCNLWPSIHTRSTPCGERNRRSPGELIDGRRRPLTGGKYRLSE